MINNSIYLTLLHSFDEFDTSNKSCQCLMAITKQPSVLSIAFSKCKIRLVDLLFFLLIHIDSIMTNVNLQCSHQIDSRNQLETDLSSEIGPWLNKKRYAQRIAQPKLGLHRAQSVYLCCSDLVFEIYKIPYNL